jgi:APA family basic amino acid/polyamine antiporter
VLLSAMAGVGRTTLAMARDHELPAPLAAVHPRFAVPHRAELLLGLIVIAVVSTTDVRGAIGFSSTGVLVYYAITNASAWTLPGQARTWRRPVAALGLLGCLLLVATLPPVSVVTGLGVLAGAVLVRAVLQSREPRKQQP